jgi:hypothetical protein
LEQHLDSLETLLLVVQFTPNDIIANFTVFTALSSQVAKHLFWAKVFPCNFLGVVEALSDL